MLLLQPNQVQFCSVSLSSADGTRIFSGISYREQLFSRLESYPTEQRDLALKAARTYADTVPNQGAIIVLDDAKTLSLWQADARLSRHTAPPASLTLNLETFDLETLVMEMRSPEGLPIQDRGSWLIPKRRTFQGQALVQWLQDRYNCSVEVASQLGQRLITEDRIYQLQFKQEFKGDRSLYRFYIDEISPG